MIINRITAIGLIIFASVALGGTVFPQTPKKPAPKRSTRINPAPQEDAPMKDSSDHFSLSDDDAYITSALWSDVKGKPRYVRVKINYRIASSDREAAQNDVFSMGGDFEESRKVDSEAHDIELDAGGNIKKYEVKYYNGGRLVAKRDLLASYAWVAKPIQERGVKYHRRALDESEKESVKIQ